MTKFAQKSAPRSRLPKSPAIWVMVGTMALAAFVVLKVASRAPSAVLTEATAEIAPAPQTLADLLTRTPEELEALDLALVNLLTAEGLRGSESLNIQECLRVLDEWTRRVDYEVKRNYHRFLAHPEDYNHSEAE